VQDVDACQKNFDIVADVPLCSGTRDGTCLTAAQKSAVIAVFSGPRNSRGDQLYANWAYDTGLLSTDWAQWKFVNSVGNRGPVSMAFIFQTPPANPSVASDTLGYALNFNMDIDAPRIFASNATYTESAMSFMTPPHPEDLSLLKNRGAKLIIVHGVSDPVFSVNDTTAFYENLRAANGGDASDFARYFRVPGMTHSGNGPSTDQFDLITAALKWVEEGQAPDRILATARGPGNAIVNPEVPASWSPNRTRPLCPYPKVARYLGTGNVEVADSFACQ
jgi:feruloyl esterase